MKKLILILFFIISIIDISYSQKISEIGMSDIEILSLENDTCYVDTLDDGTKFLIRTIPKNNNEILYFFNDKNECFFLVLCFFEQESIEAFVTYLNQIYVRDNNIWKSKDEIYYITYDIKTFDKPVFFISSENTELPTKWEKYRQLQMP